MVDYSIRDIGKTNVNKYALEAEEEEKKRKEEKELKEEFQNLIDDTKTYLEENEMHRINEGLDKIVDSILKDDSNENKKDNTNEIPIIDIIPAIDEKTPDETSNNQGTLVPPDEYEVQTNKNKFELKYICMIGGAVIVLLTIIVLIIIKMKRKSKKDNSNVENIEQMQINNLSLSEDNINNSNNYSYPDSSNLQIPEQQPTKNNYQYYDNKMNSKDYSAYAQDGHYTEPPKAYTRTTPNVDPMNYIEPLDLNEPVDPKLCTQTTTNADRNIYVQTTTTQDRGIYVQTTTTQDRGIYAQTTTS